VSVDTLNSLAKALDIPPACLAILGSRNIGNDKVATKFMQDLQGLISSVLLAQAKLGGNDKARRAAARVRERIDTRGKKRRAHTGSSRTSKKIAV